MRVSEDKNGVGWMGWDEPEGHRSYVRCGKCGQGARGSANYCANCGDRLRFSCSSCDQILPEKRSCRHCGSEIFKTGLMGAKCSTCGKGQ